MINLNIFSMRLKWLREKKGLGQKDIASALGLSQPGYSKIELGQREPNLDALSKLPFILGEPVDFMIGVTNDTRQITLKKGELRRCENTIRYGKEQLDMMVEKKLPVVDNMVFTEDSAFNPDYLVDHIEKHIKRAAEIRIELEAMISEVPKIK